MPWLDELDQQRHIQIETVICLTKWCPTQWLLIARTGETYFARFRYEDLTVNLHYGEKLFCEPQQTEAKHCMSFPELKSALEGCFTFPEWVHQKLLVDDPYSDVPGTMPCGQWKFELDTPRETSETMRDPKRYVCYCRAPDPGSLDGRCKYCGLTDEQIVARNDHFASVCSLCFDRVKVLETRPAPESLREIHE